MSDRAPGIGPCGPGDVDCREVLEEVYLYLDGELTCESQEVIRRHLDDCTPCLRKYGLEQDVKALVARCCGGDSAPNGLRSKVLARLREVTVGLDEDAAGIAMTVTTETVEISTTR